MIANLITTILLALGVASGSYQSETCNAFNHVLEEQPKANKKKAIETINETVQLRQNGSQYNYTATQSTGATDTYTVKKYYLDDSTKSNYTQPYANFYNTTYSFYKLWRLSSLNYKAEETVTYSLLAITNYYPSTMEFELAIQNYVQSTANGHQYEDVWLTDNTLENYIDKTLNSSLRNDLDNYINTLPNSQKIYTYNFNMTTPSSGYYETEMPTTTITLQPEQTVYVLMKLRIQYETTSNNSQVRVLSNTPTEMTINGNVIVPDYPTQEIVDIPNLMFTIVTLPFAFYSTAFNLTVFPGTPYALNFGNIILTIIAALILLYLIKKVIR